MRYHWTSEHVGALQTLARRFTAAEIARQLGVTTVAVRKAAQRYGVSLRKTGERHHHNKLSREQRSQIEALRRKGLTYRAIHNTLAIPVTTIFDHCRKRGIP